MEWADHPHRCDLLLCQVQIQDQTNVHVPADKDAHPSPLKSKKLASYHKKEDQSVCPADSYQTQAQSWYCAKVPACVLPETL